MNFRIFFLYELLLLYGIIYVFAGKESELELLSPQLKEYIINFKAVSMHFIEPFLNDVEVKGVDMGGFYTSDIVPIVSKIMIESASNLENSDQQNTMIEFAKALEKSLIIYDSVLKLKDGHVSPLNVEGMMFPKAKDEYIAVPSGWAGPLAHSVLLIIKKVSPPHNPEKFDLTVINTGSGSMYHEAKDDSDNHIAPLVYRVWKEFEDIPKSEFTDGENWFVKSLAVLLDSERMETALKDGAKPEKYFYETILGNFKNYEKPDDSTDDRFIKGQLSGSCSYSSLIAGLLYFSNSKSNQEFLKIKYIYGLALLKNFIDKFADINMTKEILGDAYEPMARYLMKHLVSGIAFQSLEFLESEGIELGYAGLIGEKKGRVPPYLTKLASFRHLSKIQDAAKYALKIKNLLIDTKINYKTAEVVHEDISKSVAERISKTVFNRAKISLSKEDIEKMKIDETNWPGVSHPFISGETAYTNFFPKQFTSLDQLASKLQEIANKSDKELHLDTIMNTYLYDFFKIAKPDIQSLIDTNRAGNSPYLTILKSARKLMRNFMEESILPMAVEDLAAITQLLLLTWKVAVKYDSMQLNPLGLSAFSAPISNDFMVQVPDFGDPNTVNYVKEKYSFVALDTCAAAPFWLTTEDEYEAWIIFQQAKTELMAERSSKKSIFDPSFFFSKLNHNPSCSASVLKSYSGLEILKKIANSKEFESALRFGVDYTKFRYRDLLGPYFAIRGGLQSPKLFPQFNHLIDVASYFYFGPWYRPFGTPKDGTDMTFAQFNTYDMIFGPYIHVDEPKRSEKTKYPFIRNAATIELIEQRKLAQSAGLSPDFALNEFTAIRSAAAMQDPQEVVRFYAFLSLIEGSKSCVFFEHSPLVYMADRLLGIKTFFEKDPNLITRVHETMKSVIFNEMTYFKSKYESLELTKKEKYIDRMINASLVHLRFIIRLESWSLIKSEELVKLIAKLYDEWSPLGYFKSVYELTEEIVGKINVFLWDCVNSGKNFKDFSAFSKTFVNNLIEYSTAVDTENIVKAHVTYRYFIAAAFTKQMVPTGKFELFTKIYVKLRNPPPKLPNKKSADLALNLIAKEMISNYESAKTDLDKDWIYTINDDFQFIEIKKKASTSKIPFVILRLSTARIILNGVVVIHKSKIYNHTIFRKFFSKEDHVHARNGSIKPIGDKIGYSLPGFRGTGQNFLFITNGDEAIMDIFFYYDKERWLWSNTDSKSTRAFLKPLKLMNIKGIKIYQRYYEEKNVLETIFMKGAEADPLYRLSIENVNKPEESQIKMKLPFIEKPVLLLNSTETQSKLTKALIGFANPEFISVYRTEDNRAVIMYGPYRFSNEEIPLIFEERINESDPKKKIFVLLNHDSWCIDEDQVINNGKLFLGTLKIRSITDPGSKALLVPNFKVKNKHDDESKETKKIEDKEKEKEKENNEEKVILNMKLIYVEMIKINNDGLMPKDRYERLVLAYKCMTILETDTARPLLHPIQSIDQNSPFNDEELKMIDWILTLEIENPEISALKIMTASHFYINSTNYPSIKKMAISPKIMSKITDNYLSSLRELSNKYYLHLIFPEIVQNQNLFERLFIFKLDYLVKLVELKYVTVNSDILSAYLNKVDNFLSGASRAIKLKKPKELDLNFYDWRTINYSLNFNENNFWHLFDLIKTRNMATNYYRLHYRRNEVPEAIKSTVDNFDFELLLYCAHKDADFFRIFSSLAENRESVFSSAIADQRREFENALTSCMVSERNEMQNAIAQPKDNSKLVTDMSLTQKVFISDLKQKSFSDDFGTLPVDEVFADKDLNFFEDLVKSITNFSTKKSLGGPKVAVKFSTEEEGKKSLVLTKLSESIKNFNSIPDSINGSIVVDLESEGKEIYEKLTKLNGNLVALISSVDTDKKKLIEELTELANTENLSDKNTDLISKLNFSNHFKKKRTFESLYGCYYSLSLDCFIQKFPHITDAKPLRDKTFIFYSKSVLFDYFNLMKDKMTNLIEAKSVTLDELAAFVVEAKKLQTFKLRIVKPGILNFEFRSKKFRLREEQTKDLEILNAKTGGMFNSIVIQRMMAAGKTLVLGTLATVLKAREKDILSILVPPSSLFQSNSASMQSRTYNYFKSRGTVLSFERIPIPSDKKSVDRVISFLKWFSDNLTITLQNRNYLVMSPDFLQSFLNSYIEFLNYYSIFKGKKELKESLQNILIQYSDIYTIFSTKSSIILDEIDMTMNPKKELNYPTTSRETYNLIAVALTADLIEFTIFSKNVHKNDLNIILNNQAGLTPTAYEKIKDIWLEYIEQSLDDTKSLWNQKLLQPKHAKITKTTIMDFLKCKDMSKYASWVNEIETGPIENRLQLRALIIMKRQVDDFLQDSFKSTVKEHFGPAGPGRPGIKFAVPYVAANTPSETSLFADRWETLNKSLLMTAVIGLNEADYPNFLFWIKEQINIESISTGSAKVTATYENFATLIDDLNPLSVDYEDPVKMKQILGELDKKNRAAIRLLFSFYLDTVISKLEFPTEQITSNALHMTSMFASVQGYSGTIDNINILPSKVVPEASKDHDLNEKNNGGITQKLISDSKDKDVAVVNGMDSVKSARNNVRNILKAISEPDQVNLSALIDVGAFFKNFRNAKVAEALLRIISPRIKCVIYYDESTNMLQYVVEKVTIKDDSSASVLSKSGEMSPKPEDKKKWTFTHGKLALSDPDSITKTTGFGLTERFTFYDQRHITGSDILQPPNAIALLTFGSRNLLRDILQGALRMRQFMTTQRVFFAITPDLISYYNSLLSTKLTSLKTSNVIALSAFNEDEKQGRENAALSFVKIDVEIRREMLKKITEKIQDAKTSGDLSKIDEIKNYFTSSRGLFIRNFSENPLLWVKERKFIDAEVSLQNFVNSREKVINNDGKDIIIDFTSLRGSLIAKCDPTAAITESVLCFAPKELPEFENDAMMNSEMQLELNSLQLNEVELESINEDSKFKDLVIAYPRLRLHECSTHKSFAPFQNTISYNLIVKNRYLNEKAKDLIRGSLFDEGLDNIWFSRELVNIVDVVDNVCPYNLFGSFNLEGTHIFIVMNDTGSYDTMLVSADVAFQILDDHNSKLSCGREWYLTDLMGNVVVSHSLTYKNKNILNEKSSIGKQFVNLLVINGSLLQLTTQPVLKKIFFKEWVKEKGVNGGLSFLLGRMKVLQNKLNFIYDSEDPLLTTISRVINGDTEAESSLINETYNSNEEIMKKKEMAKSASSGSSSIYRAQGVYDKISLKREVKNDDLIYVYDRSYSDIADAGAESDSDDETPGLNSDKVIDMLDFDELSTIINDKTIHTGGGKPGTNFKPGSGSGTGTESGSTYTTPSSNSNSGTVIIIVVIVALAGIGGGGYWYFYVYESENKVEDESHLDKNGKSDGADETDSYIRSPAYDSVDINPTFTSNSYSAADNYYSNNSYNNPSYYNAYSTPNISSYNGSTNGYYNTNNSGYNSSGYGYDNGYNTNGYNATGQNTSHYNNGYYDAYNSGYGSPVYSENSQSPPTSPPAYENQTNNENTDDFTFSEKK